MELPATDTVYKITGMPRWQRNWINAHRSINYSGLVQELLCDVIKARDPEYYEKYKHLLNSRHPRKAEVLEELKKAMA